MVVVRLFVVLLLIFVSLGFSFFSFFVDRLVSLVMVGVVLGLSLWNCLVILGFRVVEILIRLVD